MKLLILTAVVLVGAVYGVNVPTTSYSTYHGNHVTTNHGPSLDYHPFTTKSSYPTATSTSYFGNYFGQPPYFGAAPAPLPSQMCPALPPACQKSRYRTLDGSCNNLQNPTWGTANNRYGRLLAPRYGDGISSPTSSVSGQPLPSARLVSLVVFGEADIPDPQFTLANMQWGQIMTHDMSMQAGGTQSRKHGTRCCTDAGKLVSTGAHATCFPIIVPKNDPAHSQTGTECLNFVRTLTDRDQNCPIKGQTSTRPAEQLSTVTAYLDLSLVYGNSEQQNRPIRAFTGGRMLVENRGGHEWPPQAPNATASCDVQTPQETCYLAGDSRVNQNPGLTVLQIVLLREHNRIADKLQSLNPQWDDEMCFQESRKINIGQYQWISYYEWLPIFLGRENMIKNRLIFQTTKGSFVNDYNQNIDPSVLNSHATAAFRYFHSQIEGRLDLIAESRSRVGSLRLSDWLNRPVIVESGDNYDFLSRGLATQPEELTDINFDTEIKHFLFRRGMPFGSDLRAIDVQRNRDHGLASYNDFRQFCGLRRASGWEDFLDLISQKDVDSLRSLYASHEDVEVTVGASLESHVAGALAGPTFLCILTEQFYRTRVGDRFFFEHGDEKTGFNREQLGEIRKSSMARLFCDNGNHIEQMQPKAFLRVSAQNQIVSCSQLPKPDLSLWSDVSSFASLENDSYEPSSDEFPTYYSTFTT